MASSFKLYTFFPRIRTTQKNSLSLSQLFRKPQKYTKSEHQRQAIQKTTQKKVFTQMSLFTIFYKSSSFLMVFFSQEKPNFPNGIVGTFSHWFWTSPPRPRTGKGLPSLGAFRKSEKKLHHLLIVVEWLSIGPKKSLSIDVFFQPKTSKKGLAKTKSLWGGLISRGGWVVALRGWDSYMIAWFGTLVLPSRKLTGSSPLKKEAFPKKSLQTHQCWVGTY